MYRQDLKLPCRCVLSLKPLVDYWAHDLAPSDPHWRSVFAGMEDKLRDAPQLLEPIEDLSVVEPHRDLVKALFTAVFPPATWDTDVVGAFVPFTLEPVHVSPLLRRLALDDRGAFRGRPDMEWEAYVRTRMIRFYLLILRRCYGVKTEPDNPIVCITEDPPTGLDRYLMFMPDLRFIQVHNTGGPERLSDGDLNRAMEHLAEPEVLREIMPPENFEFRGFSVMHAQDVTESRGMSALERDLIDRESIFSQSGFVRLQQRLRTIFQVPDLTASVSVVQGDRVLLLNTGCVMKRNCIFADSHHVPLKEFAGSLFAKAAASGEVLPIRDLLEVPTRTAVEEQMIDAGLRSLLIAPLHFQDRLVGTLDVCSSSAGVFGPTHQMLAGQIRPIFSMALKRALDELDSQVQNVIREKCTAIHPSVEWRFRKAVFNHLKRVSFGHASDLDPIVFRDVYPLYAASDIRGSSEARNRAILDDLSEHLNLSLDVINSASRARPLPILEELSHRVDEHLRRIQNGLGTGDEMAVLDFLRRDVEPLFPHLQSLGPDVPAAVSSYATALDPTIGTVYRKRKEFEKSVSLFNERISGYLESEEAEAQRMFPHYFDKHQTDGIDYLIYLGASMVEDGAFDEMYVKNLRLWQLMVACGIAWHARRLKADLSVPLDVTHLVVVNHSPHSIRFRFDEKRFDVDGAYDVAHEIIRSRIDKAVVRGNKERLTQPDKIAVVYSRPEEALEMRRHISFLQSRGFLNGDVEALEIEDLPGVQGLRGLRVGINLEATALEERAERMWGQAT